jgi:hypothetical protein
VEVTFHVALDDTVVAEGGVSGRQTSKLPNALAIVLKGTKIIGPNDALFRGIKSGRVSDGQEIFFFLEKGDVAGRMAGSIMNGPYNPCPQVYSVPTFDNGVWLKRVAFKLDG